MRKIIPVCALLAVCACQQDIAVPTAKDLIENRQLLTEWQGKCNTGEYSQLAAAEKARLCATTQEATISVAEAAAAKKAGDFYDANAIRK